MPLYLIDGQINIENYKQYCQNHKIKPENAVFIFPGNASHHTKESTLFSIKSGGGLARAAAQIGREGYATLSLPTTNMEKWEKDKKQQEIVQTAIADLYRAAGAGYHIILPVRFHENEDYFDEGLGAEQLYEPNFWGGIQSVPNLLLARHYLEQLNLLNEFLDQDEDKQKENPFFQAYQDGKDMDPNHPWLQSHPLKMRGDTKESTSNSNAGAELSLFSIDKNAGATEVSNQTFPLSYEKLYQRGQNSLDSARQLLVDYTKNDSSFLRLLHGHWNDRHYVKEVNELVKKIDDMQITTLDDLISAFDNIQANSEHTSDPLFRRIQFIKNHREEEQKSQFDLNNDLS
ncbi:DUF5617 domain-containing protein [Legionella israelensis]|uniref:RavJ-like C-terminal domain-containing protein n=1 Tax=Legionella israelensis TaxID=454 RepID=A0A0W0WI89_9GAMM|nr:DUF5617 domain-containing protein [Legionella israelensis]KTD32016.1 hypothetical protein Lisr_0535 [Legionella israelensis]QBS10103.1 hypothetical protein E4T55_09705 [Legionella israelensis]SCX96930.1 hypothetical protein SAMN02746069_00820 [Legionella israelensis DSM 19235]STX59688.1 Uncharacterised protein [Legionella israelensis]